MLTTYTFSFSFEFFFTDFMVVPLIAQNCMFRCRKLEIQREGSTKYFASNFLLYLTMTPQIFSSYTWSQAICPYTNKPMALCIHYSLLRHVNLYGLRFP